MMTKKITVPILIFASSIAMSQEINTSLGSVKYKVNQDKSITYLGSTLNYSLDKFKYNGTFAQNIQINSYSFSDKKLNINYTEQIGKTEATSFSLKYDKFSFSSQENRDFTTNAYSYQDKNFNVSYSNKLHKNHTENNFKISSGKNQLSITNFENSNYEKTFVNFKNDKMDFKSITGPEIDIQYLATPNFVVAHSDEQSFVQSNIKDFKYKIAFSDQKTEYSFAYKNISYVNNDWSYNMKINNQLSAEIGSDRKIHTVKYATKIDDSNLSMTYTNQFDIYDFYFNQTVFNIYQNNFNLITNSKRKTADSLAFNLNNPKYNLKVDAINDLWNVNFNSKYGLSFGYLKDQKHNYFTLSKQGNLTIQYNVLTEKIDRLTLTWSKKF